MKKTILCIGLGVLDIIARPVGAPDSWKEKQRIESISLLPGGDGANQSIHLASLGYHAMFNGCIGDDTNGRTIREALTTRGVDTSLMRIKEGIRTGTALLLVSSEGDRHIFSLQGAHSTLDKNDLPKEIPDGCAAVTLGSLFGMPLAERDGLEAFLKKVRERDIPVFADLDSGRVTPNLDGVGPLLPMIDYFLPSYYDILPMTGESTVEAAAAKLLSCGVKNLIVKCGEKGAIIFGRNICADGISVPAFRVRPLDTTGAGDCMSAAFIARIIEGDTLEDACRYACAAGSYSTLFPGANTVVLTDEKVREVLEKGTVTHI